MSREYHLPDLISQCPKKTAPINVRFAGLEEKFNKWADTLPGPLGTQCKGGQLPVFVACCFPTADEKSLWAITQYLIATILLDRANETAPVETASENAEMYITAFKHPSTGRADSRPFVKLISSLALVARTGISEAYMTDFLEANAAFANATAQEAKERKAALKNNVKLTVETYLQTRRTSVCMRPYLVYVRAGRPLEISPDQLDSANVKALEEAAIDLIIFPNDIYSYKKELAEDGAPHNILTVLMQNTPGMDVQGAIDEASSLFCKALEKFNRCRAALPVEASQLQQYADAMVDIFVGAMQWEVVSPRYKVFDNHEDREKGVIRF